MLIYVPLVMVLILILAQILVVTLEDYPPPRPNCFNPNLQILPLQGLCGTEFDHF